MGDSIATDLVPGGGMSDEELAVVGFLARYSGHTRSRYESGLRLLFAWCYQHRTPVRHSDPRVTAGYDRNRTNLDRHAVHTLMNFLNEGRTAGHGNDDDQSDGIGGALHEEERRPDR